MKKAPRVTTSIPRRVARTVTGLRRAHTDQQQQFPQGTWTPAPAQQHTAPPKVKLLPFWPKDPNSWFTLADSTFLQVKVASSRLIYIC